jgi:hypothetical protein
MRSGSDRPRKRPERGPRPTNFSKLPKGPNVKYRIAQLTRIAYVIALLATLSREAKKRPPFLSTAFQGKKLQQGNPARVTPPFGGPTPLFGPNPLWPLSPKLPLLLSTACSHQHYP